MKTVPPSPIPEKHSRAHNSTTGAHYVATCPLCARKNLAWPNEWRDRKPEGTNKCSHFDGLNTAGAFRFRKGAKVTFTRSGARINGIFLKGATIEWLAFALDELEGSGVRNFDSAHHELVAVLHSVFAVSSSCAFGDALNDRFNLIHAEVDRLYRLERKASA